MLDNFVILFTLLFYLCNNASYYCAFDLNVKLTVVQFQQMPSFT